MVQWWCNLAKIHPILWCARGAAHGKCLTRSTQLCKCLRECCGQLLATWCWVLGPGPGWTLTAGAWPWRTSARAEAHAMNATEPRSNALFSCDISPAPSTDKACQGASCKEKIVKWPRSIFIKQAKRMLYIWTTAFGKMLFGAERQ